MYERFYGFKERPFSLLPDPDFLFLGEKHRTALALLELAIFNHSGFCVISGEIGAGKTTLIRELLNRLDDTMRVGLVSNTHPSFGELLQWIMAAYGLTCGTNDQLELHKRFIDFVIQQYAEKKHTLLIIDEAQNLSVPAMEELRMLSNVNSDKNLVLQIILIGQQQLRDKLQKPELEQFAQRIALDYHLDGLNREETLRYIQHRVIHAGGAPELFSEAACNAVFSICNGIPRLINRICDLSLVYGYSEESPIITVDIVNSVVENQHMHSLLEASSRWVAAAEGIRAGRSALVQPLDKVRGMGLEKRIEPKDDVAVDRAANTADTLRLAAARTNQSSPERPGAVTDVQESEEGAGAIRPSISEQQLDKTDTPQQYKQKSAESEAFLAEKAVQDDISARSDKGSVMADSHAEASGNKQDTTVSPIAVSNIVVDAMNANPQMEKRRKPVRRLHEQEDSKAKSQLHALVVNAEQNKQAESRHRPLWLLMGVVIIVAVTGWMTREFWGPALFDPVASANGKHPTKFLPEKAITLFSGSPSKINNVPKSGWQGKADSENRAIESVGYVAQQRDAVAATR